MDYQKMREAKKDLNEAEKELRGWKSKLRNRQKAMENIKGDLDKADQGTPRHKELLAKNFRKQRDVDEATVLTAQCQGRCDEIVEKLKGAEW